MEQAGRAGQLDLSLDRPADAVQQFRTALQRAELRDDLSAISDYGYNLATAELIDSQPDAALATARQVKAELARRNSASSPDLELLEAIALYRTGSRTEADTLASSLEQSSQQDISSQACFLRGLIADDRNDLAGLEDASRCVNQSASGANSANALELSARISLRQGDGSAAQAAANAAADLRRQTREYYGMARCLALAGAAARQARSPSAAASFYLRAGRSAAEQGNATDARQWLQTALSLTQNAELRGEAQRVLSNIGK